VDMRGEAWVGPAHLAIAVAVAGEVGRGGRAITTRVTLSGVTRTGSEASSSRGEGGSLVESGVVREAGGSGRARRLTPRLAELVVDKEMTGRVAPPPLARVGGRVWVSGVKWTVSWGAV
jgi:hypothetical protein